MPLWAVRSLILLVQPTFWLDIVTLCRILSALQRHAMRSPLTATREPWQCGKSFPRLRCPWLCSTARLCCSIMGQRSNYLVASYSTTVLEITAEIMIKKNDCIRSCQGEDLLRQSLLICCSLKSVLVFRRLFSFSIAQKFFIASLQKNCIATGLHLALQLSHIRVGN